jgi:hypothetical protein
MRDKASVKPRFLAEIGMCSGHVHVATCARVNMCAAGCRGVGRRLFIVYVSITIYIIKAFSKVVLKNCLHLLVWTTCRRCRKLRNVLVVGQFEILGLAEE